MSIVISRLEPSQTGGLWPYLEPGVKEIHRKSRGTFGWTPETVKLALKNRIATAYLVYRDGVRGGFFVLRWLQESFTPKNYCQVWLAWRDRKSASWGEQPIQAAMDHIVKEAKANSCQYVEMDSNIPAWLRHAGKFNLAPHRMVFRREV